MPSSLRQLVESHALALIAIGERLGARDIELCGSVARETDHGGSDIDFFVGSFSAASPQSAAQEALALEQAFRRELGEGAPAIDIRGNGSPVWLLDDPPADTPNYREGAIPLSQLVGETRS